MILAPILLSLCAPPSVTETAPSGRFVEARTASVFAGACHYNGELVSDGREALLAWQFEAGSHCGVDFAGLALSALIVDDENLSLAPRARRSVLYVPFQLSEPKRSALVEWAQVTHGADLGQVIAVRFADIHIDCEDEFFALQIAGVAELRGNALPDRACCKMPFQVWYTPFEATTAQLVGRDERFEVDEPLLQRRWSRPGENAAFFGRFAR